MYVLETVALLIALSYELCFNYQSNSIFNEFKNPRGALYTFLKVIYVTYVPFIFFFYVKCIFRTMLWRLFLQNLEVFKTKLNVSSIFKSQIKHLLALYIEIT